MSQGLKPCRECGNPHPDIESGDIVRCDECGRVEGFDDWQRPRWDDLPADGVHRVYGPDGSIDKDIPKPDSEVF